MITNTIIKIRSELVNTFDSVFLACQYDNELLHFAPANNGWTIAAILEHIALTNNSLLWQIRKGTKRALEKAKSIGIGHQLQQYSLDWSRLQATSSPSAIAWQHPQQFEPTGLLPLSEIREQLHNQLIECLNYLNELRNGEGALHVPMMNVNGLGKMDVYHYICFLAQHAKRHLVQISQIKEKYEQASVCS